MNDAEKRIWQSIINILKPHGNIDLIEWAKRNCYALNSPKSNTIDFNLTPYFKEIFMEVISNPSLKQVMVCAPVGSGKSALMQGLAITSVALYPKEIMYVAQSENMTLDWLNLNLKPAMKKNKTIARMWPIKTYDRKESIHFPTANIFTGYATALNTLQSRSIDLLLCDEIWMYEKEGVLEEAARRLHDRVGSRMVGVSQGGIIGDQFHKAYSLGLIKKYAWKCECGNDNIYKFDDLKFDYQKEEDGTPIYKSIYAELECPCCNKRYADIIENRRKLSEGGYYITENPDQNHLPNHVSYHFNQLAVYDVSWTQLAREFLTANSSNMKRTALRQFQQKKLGEFYDESKNVETINLESLDGGYKMDDYKFEPWDVRLLTADIQADRMFVVIRDWSKQGASRLVAYKYCSTFADLEKIRVEYNIKSKCVMVDSAYRPEEVKMAGAQFGWLGCNGRGDGLFKWPEQNGKKIEKVYSPPTNYQIKTNTGLRNFQVVNYSGLAIKDILTTIQNNPNHRWEIANDGENYAMYVHQLTSEVREINKVTGKPYYRKLKDQNHSYDCEVEQIVAAMVHGIIVYADTEID
jgi:phage terminase large subunit GpA-like protein